MLKAIAANIAADEYKHYRLFLDTLAQQTEKPLPFWKRLWVALGRASEAEDDELGYAFYCGNTPLSEIGKRPYDRKAAIRDYRRPIMNRYKPHHCKKAAQMIALAVGADPKGWLARTTSWLMWTLYEPAGPHGLTHNPLSSAFNASLAGSAPERGRLSRPSLGAAGGGGRRSSERSNPRALSARPGDGRLRPGAQGELSRPLAQPARADGGATGSRR